MSHYNAISAQQRVNQSIELRPFYDIIVEYDWPNIQDHIDWVCTAPIADILEWAQDIRKDEQEAD
jgi:hypothetical protein